MSIKAPGVYVVDDDAFPSSIVEVATAVPAFIGYTEKAEGKGHSLLMRPCRITSMAQYTAYFGGAAPAQFDVAKADGAPDDVLVRTVEHTGRHYRVRRTDHPFLLFHSMMLFFQNGGGTCYVVSAGTYAGGIEATPLQAGIDALLLEAEPTIVVVPDAVRLSVEHCAVVQQAALAHCNKTRSRFAILDVHGGYRDGSSSDPIAEFRDNVGNTGLDFGAAYYPWLHTSIVQDSDLTYEAFDANALHTVIRDELVERYGAGDARVAAIDPITRKKDDWKNDKGDPLTEDMITSEKRLLDNALVALSPLYVAIVREAKTILNLLPPAAAIAGVYTMVDTTRGVWTAPANVSLSEVIAPAVQITQEDQQDLGAPLQGKAVNAIRAFIGQGILVWGARTLDSNSLDWRYIPVRRTVLMLEESIRLAIRAYAGNANDAQTWTTIKATIGNFLTGIWQRGGLAGARADQAFTVSVGLGETMTNEDILAGILGVTVQVAVSHPAEFITFAVQQQMQKS